MILESDTRLFKEKIGSNKAESLFMNTVERIVYAFRVKFKFILACLLSISLELPENKIFKKKIKLSITRILYCVLEIVLSKVQLGPSF